MATRSRLSLLVEVSYVSFKKPGTSRGSLKRHFIVPSRDIAGVSMAISSVGSFSSAEETWPD